MFRILSSGYLQIAFSSLQQEMLNPDRPISNPLFCFRMKQKKNKGSADTESESNLAGLVCDG